MQYHDIEQFKGDLRREDPQDLVTRWLSSSSPHAFDSSEALAHFIDAIREDYPAAQNIQIAGTANWRYSLNPGKHFSEFHEHSDIDVVIVSPVDFMRTWDELRLLHRKQWYAWAFNLQRNVLRTGQNVYCGFVSPKHIPDRSNGYRFNFLRRCNAYSTSLVGHRDVNMMFFKCDEDVIDYYIRGVRIARSKV